MNEAHGAVMMADQVMRSQRISRMRMEHNTKLACINSSLGCAVFTKFEAKRGHPDVAYTVGLAERGFAELVMLGSHQIPNLSKALDAIGRWWDDSHGAMAGICPYDPQFRTLRIDTGQFLNGYGWMLNEYYYLFKVKGLVVYQILERNHQGHWPDEPQFKWQAGGAFALPQVPFGHREVTYAKPA